jgi:tRNA(Ile)-lysidine synthase
VTNLVEHVEKSIFARKLLTRRQGILVAVSGGLDSMTLLHVLQHLMSDHGWKLTVAHLNHQLRGRNSDGDERFVKDSCARLKLACVVERANVRTHAKKLGLSIEMAARKLRHEFFARTARKLGVSTVALAHHADDQVELFFLRLLRGTGTEGLAGMKWRARSPADPSITVIRPLLDVCREELKEFAQAQHVQFREDASNASCDFLRNRVRHDLLPLLRRRFQPGLNRTVLRLMDILGAESELMTEMAQAHLKAKSPFSSLPVAVQRRVLQSQLQQHNFPVEFEMIERLRLNPNQAISISPLVSVARDKKGRIQTRMGEHWSFNPKTRPVTLEGRAGEFDFDGVHFRWQLKCGKDPRRLRHRSGRECFDADKVGTRIWLRHWREADRFRPIGMQANVKLQNWFTNRKIPRALRRQLVVATTENGEIFWIEDQRISEQFKLTSRTQKRLSWCWQRL